LSFVLAIATGVLLVALFPAFNLALLAPVALVPLLWALAREPRQGRRFLLGWIAGAVFWGGACYWIYYVMHVYGHVPAAGAAGLLLGFLLVKGLHLGVFGWAAGWPLQKPWAIPAVAALWTAVEGTHPYAGFTWLMLGNAAANMSVLARLAPLTGVLGMSFVLAMMNAAVALALLRRPRLHLAWLLAVPLLYLLPRLPDFQNGNRVARLVQPNISEDDPGGWTQERSESVMAHLFALSSSRPHQEQKPDLIVWPENPAPFYFYTDPAFRSYVQTVARNEKTYLLFGTVAFRGSQGRDPLNAAVLVGPEGNEISRYDKIYLVPFGEFVPWPFGYLVEKVTREAGDFVAGDRIVVSRSGEHRIGTFICYESVFGNGVRKFAASGAELLVNISNDGWFGQSAARDQHLLIARMRAMENRRWLLRATNSGITAVIDPAGRVRATLPAARPGVLDGRFDYIDEKTLYTRWGDWFWWAAAAAALAQTGTAVLSTKANNAKVKDFSL
jgi:apolipoprotein N-acyltransferase